MSSSITCYAVELKFLSMLPRVATQEATLIDIRARLSVGKPIVCLQYVITWLENFCL